MDQPGLPEISAPRYPKGGVAKSGRKRTRLFAFWLDKGLHPYEAYLKAAFPVLGVKGPSGQVWETGVDIDEARRAADRLARSPKIQSWIAAWNTPVQERLRSLQAEAVYVLEQALQMRDKDGNVHARAIQAVENILDRTGMGRAQKLTHLHAKVPTLQESDELRRNVLEAIARDGAIEVAAAPAPALPSPGGEGDASTD